MNIDQIETNILGVAKIGGGALASFGLITAQQAATLTANLPAGGTTGTASGVGFFLAFIGVVLAVAAQVTEHFSNATPATPAAPAAAVPPKTS